MIAFTAPLSPLLHTLHATAPASRWLAAGDGSETLLFLAQSPHAWRYAALQAVHELVEGTLHRHAGVTRADLNAADIASLDGHIPHTPAHAAAVALETSLALALRIDHGTYAQVTRGVLPSVRHFSRFSVQPSPLEAPLVAAILADIQGHR